MSKSIKKSIKKLRLNKETVSKLNEKQMNVVKGGNTSFQQTRYWTCDC